MRLPSLRRRHGGQQTDPPVAGAFGLRVGFIGDRPLQALGRWVHWFKIDPREASAESLPEHLDLVVYESGDVGEVVDRLAPHESDTRVVSYIPSGASRVLAARSDLVLEEGDNFLVPIDPTKVNPRGFVQMTPADFAVLGDQFHTSDASVSDAMKELRSEIVTVPPDSSIAALRRYRAVIDHESFSANPCERAQRLVRLAAGGVPILILDDLGPSVTDLLGPEVSGALLEVSLETLFDSEARERASVEVRRRALEEHSVENRWRWIARMLDIPLRVRPTVSLLLATSRPGRLAHVVEQVNRQKYVNCELVLVMHGWDLEESQQLKLDRSCSIPVRSVSVDGAMTFGDALNVGLDLCSGQFVTKMDDDDWYQEDHVSDLVQAIGYSGADLVGKAAEFVYLQELDITLRRFVGSSENASRTLAGGTLMMRREGFRRFGDWPRVRREVDRHLIDAVLATGGRLYRTHGYGYILNRHGVSHTWKSDLDYFLAQSHNQRRGLDFAFAGWRESPSQTQEHTSGQPSPSAVPG